MKNTLQQIIERTQLLRTKLLEANTFTSRLLVGSFWMTVSAGLAQASTFLTFIWVARLLGSETFGKFGIIQSTYSMLLIFAGFGMGLTNKKIIGEIRDSDPERCGRVIGFSNLITVIFSGILALTLFITSPLITKYILMTPELKNDIRISAIILLLLGINESQTGVLFGFELFQKIAIINIVRAVFTPIFFIVGVITGGVTGLVSAVACITAISWIITRITLHREAKKRKILITYSTIHRERALLFDFAIPTIASGILPVFAFWVSRALVIQNPYGYSQLGIFNVAEQWLLVMAFIPGQVTNSSQSILSNVYVNEDKAKAINAMLTTVLLPIGLAVLVGLPIILYSNSITALYGESFSGLSPVLIIMIAVGVLKIFGGAAGVILVTLSKMWLSFVINVIWAIAFLSATLILYRRGALGLAYANLISYLIHSILVVLLIYYTEFRSRNIQIRQVFNLRR